MLIGSKKTPLFAFLASSIKFTSGEITQAAAKPAQLRVLRNSPRAMQLSGYELVRSKQTCDESVLLSFLWLLTFENAKAEADQQYVKT